MFSFSSCVASHNMESVSNSENVISDRPYETQSSETDETSKTESNNISCENTEYEINNEFSEKSLLVIGDKPDPFCWMIDKSPAKSSNLLSPWVQEKMVAYRGQNVLFRVIVEFKYLGEDFEELDRATKENEDLRSLDEKQIMLREEISGLYEELANETDEAVRTRGYREIENKSEIIKNLRELYWERYDKIRDEFFSSIQGRKYEFAYQLCECEPIVPEDLDQSPGETAYIMELTAEDI